MMLKPWLTPVIGTMACLMALPLTAIAAEPESTDSAPASARTFSESKEVRALPAVRYIVVHSGPSEGKHPGRTSAVKVRYTGTLPDGTVFDTSQDKGEDGNVIFPLRIVIPGFAAAVQMMRPGDEWIVYVPQEMAYGENGKMAGKDLIFRITLIDFAEMAPTASPIMKELPKP